MVNPDASRHPVSTLGGLGLRDCSSRSAALTTESITRIVAESCNVQYFRIDPRKIDVTAVTNLVSRAYASRFQFLPVLLTDTQVTIATVEPYANDWESELAASAITRLMDIGEPSYLIDATLLGVVAQRLVRTLCDNCKTPVKLPPST